MDPPRLITKGELGAVSRSPDVGVGRSSPWRRRRVASHVHLPTRRHEEDDVIDIPVRVERPLPARVSVGGRAILALVLVSALRRRRKLEEDLVPLDLLALGRVLLAHVSSLRSPCPDRGRIACTTVGEPRLAASLVLALLMPRG